MDAAGGSGDHVCEGSRRPSVFGPEEGGDPVSPADLCFPPYVGGEQDLCFVSASHKGTQSQSWTLSPVSRPLRLQQPARTWGAHIKGAKQIKETGRRFEGTDNDVSAQKI